ncbi:OmpA family protein [Photobacterium nomapromontoriensis]|uniref:OmpA family protein n=1 Tax=Photobacterium nomapromontoriensis TaxID=2910237 RepID=UPI003D11A31D
MYTRIVLASFLLFFSFASNSSQNKWNNDLDDSTWLFKGNAHQCKISQDIDGFGMVSLINNAGESLSLHIKSNEIDSATKYVGMNAIPASWERFKPYKIKGLGKITLSPLTGEMVIADAAPILDLLHRGDWFELSLSVAGQVTLVDVSNVRFPAAVAAFLDCKNQLLPMSYRQVRDSTFYLSPFSTELTTEEWYRIDGIVKYIKSQRNIKAVLVDGYMNSHQRDSMKLRQSKEMADEVASLFVEKGIAPSLIEVRAHGGRYPKEEGQPASKGRVRVRIVQL